MQIIKNKRIVRSTSEINTYIIGILPTARTSGEKRSIIDLEPRDFVLFFCLLSILYEIIIFPGLSSQNRI